MNRTQVREALQDFIRDDGLQVAALSGEWGVGKTRLWNDFAYDLTLPEALKGSAYASLFGAESLNELRLRVAMGYARRPLTWKQTIAAIPSGMGVATSKVWQFLKRLGRRTSWALVSAQRLINWRTGPLLGNAGYLLVRDSLIVLDDVERCSIEPETITGFVDELRNRGCKVVLITNRDKLNTEKRRAESETALVDDADAAAAADTDGEQSVAKPNNGSAWGQYWEKVVDCDFKLAPDPDENASIVFGESFEPAEYAAKAKEALRALGCNNIRIHKRAAWLINKIQPQISKFASHVQGQAVINATVLCWVFRDPTSDIPTSVTLERRYSRMWATVVPDERLSDEEKRWRDIIEATGFYPYEFDEHLASLIETGWYSPAELSTALTTFNDEQEQARAVESLRKINRKYAEDFDISREDYVREISQALRERIRWVYVHEFASYLAHIRNCGSDPDAIAREYIAERGEHLDQVAGARDRQPIEDPVLDAEVRRREAELLASQYSIDEVASYIALGGGHKREHIQYLANRSVQEFVDWIANRPERLRRKVEELLNLRGHNEETNERVVSDKVEGALRELAARSDWNRQRIEQFYGVVPSDENAGVSGTN